MEQVYNSRVPIKSWVSDLEKGALSQAYALSCQPYVFKHIALMPDAHQGFGMPIGGVMATKGVVVSNAVGVDIGCGVQSCKLPIREISRDVIKASREWMKESIPIGFHHHKSPQDYHLMPPGHGLTKDYIIYKEYDSALKQLGTLGGGNHFIELQRGSDGYIYLMIHSGSRNLGNKVAKHYHKIAKDKMDKYHTGVPKDLSFLSLDSQAGQDYISEMRYCVEFAKASRTHMMTKCVNILMDLLNEDFIGRLDIIDVAHNYADLEHHFGENVWVHRKGATRAYEGELGLIPGDMGSSSYIVQGLGENQSFKSCSHGAGRTMSRTKAKDTLDLEKEMNNLDKLGIIHDMRNRSKLDESPSSYKDIIQVMKNQEDLVKIKTTLIPLGGVKG